MSILTASSSSGTMTQLNLLYYVANTAVGKNSELACQPSLINGLPGNQGLRPCWLWVNVAGTSTIRSSLYTITTKPPLAIKVNLLPWLLARSQVVP